MTKRFVTYFLYILNDSEIFPNSRLDVFLNNIHPLSDRVIIETRVIYATLINKLSMLMHLWKVQIHENI